MYTKDEYSGTKFPQGGVILKVDGVFCITACKGKKSIYFFKHIWKRRNIRSEWKKTKKGSNPIGSLPMNLTKQQKTTTQQE